jgi:hypothetical protein
MAYVKPQESLGQEAAIPQADVDCGKCRWINRSITAKSSICYKCYLSEDKFNYEEGEPDETRDTEPEQMVRENSPSCPSDVS